MSETRRSLNTFVNAQVKLVKNKYRLGDAIGKGAFGKVFRSVNIFTGEVVAIKQIEKSLLQENEASTVQREIDVLQKLSHPNIVQIVEQFETKSHIYLMLELVEGGSLHDLMKRCGTFPESLLRVYMVQILEGLRYLHSLFIVHRDLKGANVLLTKEGKCKLGDFGSSVEVRTNRRLSMLSTPFWTAPEIIEGTEGGVLSDVWGVGCTVLELLTSYPPYWNQGTGVALFKMVEDPHPPFPPNLSPDMEEFLMQCFVKEYEKRASVETLLQHSWIVNPGPGGTAGSSSGPTSGSASSSPAVEAHPTSAPTSSHGGKRTSGSTIHKPSLFHSLFSKKEKDDSPPNSDRPSPALDRKQSLSGPIKKVPALKVSDGVESVDAEAGIQETQPDFNEVVSAWKDKESDSSDKDPKRPSSVQLGRSASQPFSEKEKGGRERGSTFTSTRSTPQADPRAQRREAIEGSISDWFGDSWKEEIKKEKEKEKEKDKDKKPKKKKTVTIEPLQREPSHLVKEMGKKLEQEIAKRQKLTQLLEGHKNTVSLLMEQKNELEEKYFTMLRLAREKNLKKLLATLLEEEEISDDELLTYFPSGVSLPNSHTDLSLSTSSLPSTLASPSSSNWRTPGTRCMVKTCTDIWQEGVILKQSLSASDCPGFHDYRVMLLGTLPSIEELMVGPNSLKQLGT